MEEDKSNLFKLDFPERLVINAFAERGVRQTDTSDNSSSSN
jgi:hypothetical protein